MKNNLSVKIMFGTQGAEIVPTSKQQKVLSDFAMKVFYGRDNNERIDDSTTVSRIKRIGSGTYSRKNGWDTEELEAIMKRYKEVINDPQLVGKKWKVLAGEFGKSTGALSQRIIKRLKTGK